jgi:hypothetical protein
VTLAPGGIDAAAVHAGATPAQTVYLGAQQIWATPQQWNPAQIAGLGLWLDAQQITGLAEGAPVTEWPDHSPLQYPVTWDSLSTVQQPPHYTATGFNGHPAVSFAGTVTTAQTFRIAGWGNALAGKASYSLFMVALTQELSGGEVPVILSAPYENNTWQWLIEYDLNGGMFWGHVGYRRYNAAIPPNVGCLLGFHFPNEPHMYVNGTEILEFVAYGGDMQPAILPVEYIGTDIQFNGYAGYQYGHDGLISEIIWYDHAVTEAERAQIETYLTDKWDIAPYPAQSLPGKPLGPLPPHLGGYPR